MSGTKSKAAETVSEIEAATKAIVDAAKALKEAGKTVDSDPSSYEQSLVLRLHQRVTEAKSLTAELNYAEPSSTSCDCLVR